MKQNQSRTVALETLEDRLAPAITAIVSGGTLNIRGFSSTGLIFLSTTANPGEIDISDGINTTTATGVNSINVALRGAPLSQIVSLDLQTVPNVINGSVTIDAGTAPGNQVFINAVADGSLDIMGNVNLSRGDALAVTGDVAGNVTMNNSSYGPPGGNFYTLAGSIIGNLTVTGSLYGDGVGLTGSTIGGNVRVSLARGQNGNSLNIIDSTIRGSLAYSGGAGSNNFTLSGSVLGFVTVSAGNGANKIDFDSSAFVGRSMSISLGRGTGTGNQIGVTTGFDGTINGNLTISTAGGLNQVELGATVYGPQVTIAMARGNNTVDFAAGLNVVSGRMLLNMVRGGVNVFNPNAVPVTWPFRLYY